MVYFLHKHAFLRATGPSHHLAVLSLHKLLHNSQIQTVTASLQTLADLEGTICSICSRSLYVLPFIDPSLTVGLKEVRMTPCVYVHSLGVVCSKLGLCCFQGVQTSASITCSVAAVPGHQHVPGAVLHRHQHSFRLPVPGGSATKWPRRHADRSVPC